MSRHRGFTLVEVLISVALVAMVGAAVIALISGGLRVWQRTDTLGSRDAWVQVGFDQIRRELRSMARFQPVPFAGAYDGCTFASTPDETLGVTHYYFDSGRRQLCRTQQSYPEWLAGHPAACSPILQDVQQVHFSYYAPRTATSGGEWQSSWSETKHLPLAVKLSVSYRIAASERPATYDLMVYLPTSVPPASS